MDFIFPGDGTVQIQMKDYLMESIAKSGLNIEHMATTPARKNLLDINKTAAALGKQESESFHSVVAKLLYVSLHACMDILLLVIFLCTRVSKSTKEDQAKLKHLLEYINGTLDLVYTLGADNIRAFWTWVDSS
jgi:hypothetical protein